MKRVIFALFPLVFVGPLSATSPRAAVAVALAEVELARQTQPVAQPCLCDVGGVCRCLVPTARGGMPHTATTPPAPCGGKRPCRRLHR